MLRRPRRAWKRRIVAAVVASSALATHGCAHDEYAKQISDYQVVWRDATTFQAFAEACGELRVDTVESETEVRLAVWQLHEPGDDYVGSESPIVTLAGPLARRRLVDENDDSTVATVIAEAGG